MLFPEHYLLAKTETVPGTAEAPIGSNAMEMFDISIEPLTGATVSRENIARGMNGAAEELMVEQWVKIKAKCYLSPSGVAGTPPAYGILLKASFCSEEIVAVTSVTYAPAVTNAPVTLFYDIGNGANTQRHVVTGVGGTVTLEENANQKGVLSFDLTGFYTRPITATEITPVLTSFLNGTPFDKDSVPTFTIHGFASETLSYSLDAGVKVTPRNMPGLKRIDFGGRKSVGKLSVLAPTLAAKNFFTTVESYNGATTGALNVVRGAAAGSIITITAPKVQLHNLAQGEDKGSLKFDMDMLYIPTTGDNEWSIAYT